MSQRIRVITVFVGLVLLGACAGPVPKLDSDTVALRQIHSIAVIRPPEPKAYTVLSIGHPGMAFGAIGGLIAAGDMKDKQERLSSALKDQGVAVSSNLADAISAELGKVGYATKVQDGPWEEVDGKYKVTFENIKSDADAVLVITPTIVGFVSPDAFSNYFPTITTVAILLAKDRKATLYRGFHASGWTPKAEGWKSTPATVSYPNFDSLMADTKASANSLSNAASAIATSVAGDLKR